MRYLSIVLTALVLTAAPGRALAQAVPAGSIAGTVLNAGTAAALEGVAVTVADSKLTATTDATGTFTLRDLRPGKYTLIASFVGFALSKTTVEVKSGEATVVVVPLSDGTTARTETVTVRADPFRPIASVVPSQQTLTSADIQELRGVLADDPLRAIQALPGVATDNDFRSEFSVRGSDFRHMGLSLGGVTTPWLVHSIRNYSSDSTVALINGDIVDNVTLMAGAMPQDRPGRLGAFLDYDIREGSRSRTSVRGSFGMMSGSGIVEGPIGSSKRGSWIVGVRQSYVQWLLKKLDYTGTTLGFGDVQSKFVYDVTPRQQVQFTMVAAAPGSTSCFPPSTRKWRASTPADCSRSPGDRSSDPPPCSISASRLWATASTPVTPAAWHRQAATRFWRTAFRRKNRTRPIFPGTFGRRCGCDSARTCSTSAAISPRFDSSTRHWA